LDCALSFHGLHKLIKLLEYSLEMFANIRTYSSPRVNNLQRQQWYGYHFFFKKILFNNNHLTKFNNSSKIIQSSFPQALKLCTSERKKSDWKNKNKLNIHYERGIWNLMYSKWKNPFNMLVAWLIKNMVAYTSILFAILYDLQIFNLQIL
jgi:hypothetical protein